MLLSKDYRAVIRRHRVQLVCASAVASAALLSVGNLAGVRPWVSRAEASAHGAHAPAAVAAAAGERPAAAGQGAPGQRVEAVLITVRPNGFEPAQLALPNRPFLLAVDNYSGLDGVELKLEREDDRARGVLRAFSLNRGKLRGRALTHLPPGQYVLTDANHPEWACRINVSPQ
jgi:hypothetical protein